MSRVCGPQTQWASMADLNTATSASHNMSYTKARHGQTGLDVLTTPALLLDVARMTRNIERLAARAKKLGVSLRPPFTGAFIGKLRSIGLSAEAESPEAAVRAADIIVTATTSTAPHFEAAWVQPGTHVSTMGSDAQGNRRSQATYSCRRASFAICRSNRRASERYSMRAPM